jgi:uncharacterized protein YutE (UPF0331/DUF86 family)
LVDPEAIRRRLREIDRRLGRLRAIQGEGRVAFLSDEALQAQAERHLQLAIQAAIDIANHVVAEESSQTPEDYPSTFSALGSIGVIDAELADRLRSAAGLRNILVHAYLDVDPEILWESLGKLDDLERFATGVEAFLQEPPGERRGT